MQRSFHCLGPLPSQGQIESWVYQVELVEEPLGVDGRKVAPEGRYQVLGVQEED